MTLRRKALFIIILTLISLIGILYAVSRFVFIEGLLEIERHDTHQKVEQALAALSHTLSQLEADTVDRAAWDDTYAFIESESNEYIQSNLTDETFVNLRLNVMVFIHSSGRVVFDKAFDLHNEEEIAISQGVTQYLSTTGLLLGHPGTESSPLGIILLDEGPMSIVSQPILTSDYEGPARGTLIFGRYLDSAEIDRLTQITTFPLTIRPISDIQMQTDFQKALASLSEEEPIFVQALNTQNIAGYTLIRDVYGDSSLVLRVDVPRDIYNRGQTTVYQYVLSALAVSLVVAVMAMVFMERQILSRFTSLIKGVNHIATSGDVSARISMTGGDELALVASTIDGMLGALQESEGELRESESRYRLLAENVTDVIFTMDMNLRYNYVSPSVTSLVGYSVEEFMARTLEESLTPASFEAVTKSFEEELAIEETEQKDISRSWTMELELRRKDGSTVWVEAIMTFLRDQDDQAIGILGVSRDIAERKEAREKLEELYEHEKDLRLELENEMQKRVEFTRALVHELKTPITPVLAASELLLEEVKDERILGLVQSIDRSASNLNQRIDELLDLARGELDMLKLQPESVDPIQLLQEIGYEMIPVTLRNKQSLILELPPSLPAIWVDRKRIQQVVLNILSNASKFTPAGGGITLRAREEGANLIVEVQDTGPGISKKDQERLFDPYHRLEGDRERLSGLGLGLALARSLVELHGGQIWVKSKKGEGSTFGFSVPFEATGHGEEVVETGDKS